MEVMKFLPVKYELHIHTS